MGYWEKTNKHIKKGNNSCSLCLEEKLCSLEYAENKLLREKKSVDINRFLLSLPPD